MSDPVVPPVEVSEAQQAAAQVGTAQALQQAAPAALANLATAAQAASTLAGVATVASKAIPQVAAVEAGLQLVQAGAGVASAVITAENTIPMQQARKLAIEAAIVEKEDADLKAAQASQKLFDLRKLDLEASA